LLEVVCATDALRFGFGLGECGEEHGRQDRDDRDHDEQLDERERSEFFACVFHSAVCCLFLFSVKLWAHFSDARHTVKPVFMILLAVPVPRRFHA
jgi:hypothetical protein